MSILDGPLTARPPDAYRLLRTDTMQRMTLRLTRSDREAARRAPGSSARPGPLEAALDVLAQYGWALAAGPLQVAAPGLSAVGLAGLVLLRTLRAAHAWLLLHSAPGRLEG